MRKSLFILFLIACARDIQAQKMTVDELSTAPVISQIGAAFNRIFNDYQLDSFYQKLGRLKKNKTGVVRIVHIGDSHVQAGFFPGLVRTQLQQYFGDGGRGLLFPYDAIQTTSPADISSSTNTSWKIDKVVTTGDAEDAGISGFGLRSGATGASIEISLKENTFKRLRFFLGSESTDGWIFRTNAGASSKMIRATGAASFADVELEEASNGFTISTMPSEKTHKFYGVSVETGLPGVIYHAIGVNGARFDQYNKAGKFWEQLPALQADLYIISLGTNDAQRNKFDEPDFRKELSAFISHLEKATPGVPLILTTAPDSYRNGRSNSVLRDLNMSLFEYCTEKTLPVWDLYRVTNGYGSAYGWIRKGLMHQDMVHFTAEGYQLQGQLLFNAIARGYNQYHGY